MHIRELTLFSLFAALLQAGCTQTPEANPVANVSPEYSFTYWRQKIGNYTSDQSTYNLSLVGIDIVYALSNGEEQSAIEILAGLDEQDLREHLRPVGCHLAYMRKEEEIEAFATHLDRPSDRDSLKQGAADGFNAQYLFGLAIRFAEAITHDAKRNRALMAVAERQTSVGAYDEAEKTVAKMSMPDESDIERLVTDIEEARATGKVGTREIVPATPLYLARYTALLFDGQSPLEGKAEPAETEKNFLSPVSRARYWRQNAAGYLARQRVQEAKQSIAKAMAATKQIELPGIQARNCTAIADLNIQAGDENGAHNAIDLWRQAWQQAHKARGVEMMEREISLRYVVVLLVHLGDIDRALEVADEVTAADWIGRTCVLDNQLIQLARAIEGPIPNERKTGVCYGVLYQLLLQADRRENG